MKAVIEIRIEAEGGPYVREVACVERDGHRLADIGLSLAESKSLLTAVQKIVVEHQTAEYLEDRRKCPHCGDARARKGSHTVNCKPYSATLPSIALGGAIVLASRTRRKALAHWPTCSPSM